jgi:hypothetical protein
MLEIKKTSAEVVDGTKLIINGKKDAINNTKVIPRQLITNRQTIKPEENQNTENLFEIY